METGRIGPVVARCWRRQRTDGLVACARPRPCTRARLRDPRTPSPSRTRARPRAPSPSPPARARDPTLRPCPRRLACTRPCALFEEESGCPENEAANRALDVGRRIVAAIGADRSAREGPSRRRWAAPAVWTQGLSRFQTGLGVAEERARAGWRGPGRGARACAREPWGGGRRVGSRARAGGDGDVRTRALA